MVATNILKLGVRLAQSDTSGFGIGYLGIRRRQLREHGIGR